MPERHVEGIPVEETSFELVYAAIGRALDAFCEEGDRPLGELADLSPLYALHLGHRLMEEEQKVPAGLRDLLAVMLEGVDWASQDGNAELPHTHVKQLRAALAQGDKFLTDLTAFRVTALTTEPLEGDALRELEERAPLLPSNLNAVNRARLAAEKAKAARAAREAAEAGSEPSGERVVVEMPPEVREELEAAEKRARERDFAANGPGRYIGLDLVEEDVPAEVGEGLERLAQAPDVFSPQEPERDTVEEEAAQEISGFYGGEPAPLPEGVQVYVQVSDTQEMEPVEAPESFVVLLDGVSTVSKDMVLRHAQARPAEQLQRGDVVVADGGFHVVLTRETVKDKGSRQVHVEYKGGHSRVWFPGSMVTAYRPE